MDFCTGSLHAADGHSRTADAYKVGTSLTDDGILASDHRPVFADVTI